ncbi:hypothetical protein H696_00423 [Fonticula alba]|uniref:RNA helicase n=1 Tax=Fonticula alba TaxID=691883 RepID=A0A058ZFZ6_FONAL|nr:hypothetical protein H696_00423 [Fonticula alba]KCV72848.1 hypothetical protein H696_00423 [Fonticula alba]|eukprot:XP_009492549.1 hypothetical protein H696_00423 [Fonticula alba]
MAPPRPPPASQPQPPPGRPAARKARHFQASFHSGRAHLVSERRRTADIALSAGDAPTAGGPPAPTVTVGRFDFNAPDDAPLPEPGPATGTPGPRHFDRFLLHPAVLRAIRLAGYCQPSPVQAAALPVARAGADLVVQSASGTGKTLVFAIPIAELVLSDRGASRAAAAAAAGAAASTSPGPGAHGPPVDPTRALVVAPTREIAIQIADVLRACLPEPAGSGPGAWVALCIGGQSVQDGRRSFGDPRLAPVVVGTPGRLGHLLEAGDLRLGRVRILVLDEADLLFRGLGPGRGSGAGGGGGGGGGGGSDGTTSSSTTPFHRDLLRVVRACPAPGDRQTILVSATWPPGVRRLAGEVVYGRPVGGRALGPAPSPVLVAVGRGDRPALRGLAHFHLDPGLGTAPPGALASIVASALGLPADDPEVEDLTAKVHRLSELLHANTPGPVHQAVVFARRRSHVSAVATALERLGHRVVALSSLEEQEARVRALQALRSSTARVLVSTDLAARGVDLERVNLVAMLDVGTSGPPGHAPDEGPTKAPVPMGPLDAEQAAQYFHRAGRAGRFGSFGAVVLVDRLAAVRRLAPLLGAEVLPESGPPPGDDGDYFALMNGGDLAGPEPGMRIFPCPPVLPGLIGDYLTAEPAASPPSAAKPNDTDQNAAPGHSDDEAEYTRRAAAASGRSLRALAGLLAQAEQSVMAPDDLPSAEELEGPVAGDAPRAPGPGPTAPATPPAAVASSHASTRPGSWNWPSGTTIPGPDPPWVPAPGPVCPALLTPASWPRMPLLDGRPAWPAAGAPAFLPFRRLPSDLA